MKDIAAVIYVRVSTKGQDSKYSPEVQLNSCRAYAKDEGLDIVKEFREARSGWKENARIEFYKMLEFIENQKIKHLIYGYGDRLSRNSSDYNKLLESHVVFHDAISKTSFSPNDPDDYDQTANFEHDQAEAKRYSARLSKRVITAQDLKVQKGEYPAAPPLGYLVHPIQINGKWKTEIVIDPKRGPLIKSLFDLFSTGEYSLRTITKKMENLGLRSKRYNKVLLLEEIRRYLKTTFYYGEFRWKGELHDNKNTYLPIISKALFDDVQNILDGRKINIKGGKNFKYKGLLACNYCGCAMVGDSHQKIIKKTGEIKAFTYYHCTSGKRKEFYKEKYGQEKCPLYYGPYYSEKEIEKLFEIAIDRIPYDPAVFEWLQSEIEIDFMNLQEIHKTELINLNRERSNIDSKESSIIDSMAGKNPMIQRAYEDEIERLELRKRDIDLAIEELEKGETAISLEKIKDTLVLSKSLKKSYFAADQQKREKMNRLLFSTVFVKRRRPRSAEEELILPGLEPLLFQWNEPFESLFDEKLMQDIAKLPVPELPSYDQKVSEKKKWRGRRDLNSRPLT